MEYMTARSKASLYKFSLQKLILFHTFTQKLPK